MDIDPFPLIVSFTILSSLSCFWKESASLIKVTFLTFLNSASVSVFFNLNILHLTETLFHSPHYTIFCWTRSNTITVLAQIFLTKKINFNFVRNWAYVFGRGNPTTSNYLPFVYNTQRRYSFRWIFTSNFFCDEITIPQVVAEF